MVAPDSISYPCLAIAQREGLPHEVVLLIADYLAGRRNYWTRWALVELARVRPNYQDRNALYSELERRCYLGEVA